MDIIEALQLQASLTDIRVPLDRVRSAHQQLSFIWYSILAAVFLLVILHLFAAAFQRFFDDGRLRHLFQASPPPAPAHVKSPAADVTPATAGTSTVRRDVASATPDRTIDADMERREHHHHHPGPRSYHPTLSPTTIDQLLPPSVGHEGRPRPLQYPARTATRHGPSQIGRESDRHVEGIYYMDRIVESNV